MGKNEPTLAPPRDALQPKGKNKPTPAASLGTEVPSPPPLPRTTNKPALADAPPALRAKQLTLALHGDHALWEGDAGKPVGLRDCLLRNAGGDRRATIEAYWLVWRRAAQYKSLADQQGRLKGLAAVVLERRNSPAGAADMLRLHAAQTAAKAAISEAQVALVEAQYALALRIGALADAAWPRPSTAPHSGSYLLNLDEQPRSVAESWPVRRLAAMIPGLGQSVQQRATAVVEADAARAAAAENYRSGAAAIDQVLDGVAAETEQTSAFLDSLIEYNRAIAEYVLLVRPATTPADKLVESLVVKP